MPKIEEWEIVHIDGKSRISGLIFDYSPIFEDTAPIIDGTSIITSPILEIAKIPEDDTVLALTHENFYTLGKSKYRK